MNARTLRRSAALIAAGALTAAGTAQAKPAASARAAKVAKITIQLKASDGDAVPYFSGPKTIRHGATLTIKNLTSPEEIGPHTFTLLKPGLRPKTEAAQRECGGSETTPPSGVCLKVFKAHKVNFETGEVARPDVEAGKRGWNRSFGRKGDSWVAEAKGATTHRRVTAKVGTTLTYFCAVHPDMHGKIKVVE